MRKYITLFCSVLALFSKGRAESSVDIVNGRDAKPEEFPYLVSLQRQLERLQHYCGGSIYNENYILTAAHCLAEYIAEEKEERSLIIAGTINKEEPGQIRKMEKIILHEEYKPKEQYRNDIALVKLDRPLEFNSKVQPITLVEPPAPLPKGTPLQVSGWGFTFGPLDSDGPTILQAVTVYAEDQDYCVKLYHERLNKSVYPTNICAYDTKKRAGSCNADSGGPLTHNGKQVGIVSWSKQLPDLSAGERFPPKCGSTIYPVIYTRVSEYIDWIKQHAV